LTDETIAQEFTLSMENVEEASGIQAIVSPTERHQSGSIVFYLYFLGPLGGKMGSRSVKVDITRGERILFAPVERDMYNRYADCPADPAVLRCYALEEIVVEKLVALMGRTQPRDLYDIWYLLEQEHVEIEFLKSEFETKARHKGHDPGNFQAVWDRKEKQFGSLWKQYLSHQIADLPDFEAVCRALNRHFRRF
jgi:uncharacterized protein